jgi:AcrR family transcriptional regulator
MEITQRTRRTQQERRDATRERLLDATVDCLVELGYAGTSTTEVVRRAGLSRGAQVHHFPTKAELVREAIVHLMRRQRDDLHASFERLRDRRSDRASLAVDLLWSLYAGPTFPAALELLIAARTDASLRPAVSLLQRDVRALFESMWEELLGPDALRDRTLRAALDLTIDLLHGLALGRLLENQERHERRVITRWKAELASMLADAGV